MAEYVANHARRLAAIPVRDLFAADAKRFGRFSREAAGLLFDFSRQRLDGLDLGQRDALDLDDVDAGGRIDQDTIGRAGRLAGQARLAQDGGLGAVEAPDQGVRVVQFGLERLKAALRAAAGAPAKDILDQVDKAVQAFAEGAAQLDDTTAVAIKSIVRRTAVILSWIAGSFCKMVLSE